MHSQPRLIRFALPLGMALILSACAGAGPGWTYAPLGPSPAPTGSPTPAPSGSGGTGTTIEVKTTADAQLAFSPATIDVSANTSVTINYTNDSPLPHNIHFFSGADSSAPDLGKTDVVPGPGALKSVTFTTPTAPGDYFFWCDVHTTAMTGILHVTP